jgi:hypothetical protein
MTQEQPYDVLSSFRDFEVRRYPAHLVAEVEVDASFTRAGNEAFGVLVAYISGRNSTRGKVAMTAPVLQEQASATIEMTSPVVQQPGGDSGRHVVAFVMPAEFTLDTLPTPADPRINVREVPAHVAAVKSFTGRWTEHVYELQLNELRDAVEQARPPGQRAATVRPLRSTLDTVVPASQRGGAPRLPVHSILGLGPNHRPIGGRGDEASTATSCTEGRRTIVTELLALPAPQPK